MLVPSGKLVPGFGLLISPNGAPISEEVPTVVVGYGIPATEFADGSVPVVGTEELAGLT